MNQSAFRAAEAWHPRVRKDRISLQKLRAAERSFESTVRHHLAAYLSLAVQHFESFGTASGQDADAVDRASTLYLDSLDRNFDQQAFVNALRAEYAKPLALGAAMGARDLPKGALVTRMAEDILMQVDWSLLDPEVVTWLDQQSTTLVSNVLDTTKARIRAQLSTGVLAGESRDAIAERLQRVLDDVPAWRARLIAQTEIIHAHTQGALQVYAQSDVIQGKRWVDGQPNACSLCEGLNGQVVSLDELFEGEFDGPPRHPGCRCTVAATLTAPEE